MAHAPVPDLAAVMPVKPTLTAARAPEPAVAVTKQMKELTPQQRAENEYRKATILLQHGKSAEAIDGLEQALQFDPQHAAARQMLVGALLDAARQDDAIRRAREGLAIDPAQPGLAMILARLQLDKGELKPALATLERTLPHAAERADYQSFLAALLQRDGRHKDAAEHFLLALQKTPQNGVWWMGLGISLQAEHRLPEAQEAFTRAKASNTLSPELLAFVESKLKQLQR
jgi:MSHA biogenesis protein MshN